MRIALIIVSSVVGILGVASVLAGWDAARTDLVQAGAAMLVAALVATTAAAGLKTWADEKKQARDLKEQATYAMLVRSLVGKFVFDEAQRKDGELRADVVTWGNAKVIATLSEWNRLFDEARSTMPSNPDGTLNLDREMRRKMTKATEDVAAAVRQELGAGAVSEGSISSALFNQSE